MTHINPDGQAIGGTQPDEMTLLHIYSQLFEHCEARIVGNKAGLQELVKTIEAALKCSGEAISAEEVFATDGEGYDVEVVVMPNDWNDPKWKESPPHYCDRGYDDDRH